DASPDWGLALGEGDQAFLRVLLFLVKCGDSNRNFFDLGEGLITLGIILGLPGVFHVGGDAEESAGDGERAEDRKAGEGGSRGDSGGSLGGNFGNDFGAM